MRRLHDRHHLLHRRLMRREHCLRFAGRERRVQLFRGGIRIGIRRDRKVADDLREQLPVSGRDRAEHSRARLRHQLLHLLVRLIHDLMDLLLLGGREVLAIEIEGHAHAGRRGHRGHRSRCFAGDRSQRKADDGDGEYRRDEVSHRNEYTTGTLRQRVTGRLLLLSAAWFHRAL